MAQNALLLAWLVFLNSMAVIDLYFIVTLFMFINNGTSLSKLYTVSIWQEIWVKRLASLCRHVLCCLFTLNRLELQLKVVIKFFLLQHTNLQLMHGVSQRGFHFFIFSLVLNSNVEIRIFSIVALLMHCVAVQFVFLTTDWNWTF